MQVTAEGAERLEDLQLIRSLGCDHVQGYLFGRPMEQGAASALAADSKPVDAKEAARTRPPRHSLIRRGTLHAGKEQWPVRLRNISRAARWSRASASSRSVSRSSSTLAIRFA
jgi:hypothetical protein